MGGGPACSGSHSPGGGAGPPGRDTAAVLERLLPGRRGLLLRGTAVRVAPDRAPGPDRRIASDPGGVGESPPSGPLRTAPDHAPPDGQRRGRRLVRRGRVLRPAPAGWVGGPE